MKLIKVIFGILIILMISLCVFHFLFNQHKKETSNRPDKVLLIIVDTLRADHLGCYGYQGADTKNIDNFAKSGASFSQAISPIPETGPAVSSILTSLYPYNHGVRENTTPLPRKNRTLAEILKKKGFQTAAFTDTFPFRILRILQGFDSFHKRVPVRSSEKEAVKAAIGEPLSWLKKKKNKKTFALIHFYDPHMPYTPITLSQRTQSINYQGPYTGKFGPLLLLWGGKSTINKKDIAYMTSLYDDEVKFVDRCVGIILDELKKLGYYNRTLVIITADHGESLGEHDYYFDHGDFLYEDQIRVPLIMRFPNMPEKGKIINAQVRTIDIMPTILHILDIDYKGPQDGVSLLPLIWGKKRLLATRHAFSESDSIHFRNLNNRGFIEGNKGKHVSLRKDGMKLIYVPQRPEGEFELYDLAKDPLELSNLIEEKPEIAKEMKKALFEWMVKQMKSKSKKEKLDEEARKILESLHYIHK